MLPFFRGHLSGLAGGLTVPDGRTGHDTMKNTARRVGVRSLPSSLGNARERCSISVVALRGRSGSTGRTGGRTVAEGMP